MEWYYDNNSHQAGPVSPTQFQELIQQGVITNSTLVWKDGMDDWKAYGQLQMSASSIFGAGQLASCPLCRMRFPKNDMFQHENVWVCAACKPTYLQKLANESIHGIWREEECLVVRQDSKLPNRCIQCNQDSSGFMLVKKYYFPNPFRPLRIEIPMCTAHVQKRKLLMILSLALFFLGMIVSTYGWFKNQSLILPVGLLLIILGAWGLRHAIRNIILVRRKNNFIWFRGASKAFLSNFSEWKN